MSSVKKLETEKFNPGFPILKLVISLRMDDDQEEFILNILPYFVAARANTKKNRKSRISI